MMDRVHTSSNMTKIYMIYHEDGGDILAKRRATELLGVTTQKILRPCLCHHVVNIITSISPQCNGAKYLPSSMRLLTSSYGS
jgi:hypothetical protein